MGVYMALFSQRSIDRLETCDDRLKIIFYELIKTFDCMILTGHRNQKDQEKYFSMGLSKKDWPESKHNKLPSLAIDACPYPINWKDETRFVVMYCKVKEIADSYGIKIINGGFWNGERNDLVKNHDMLDDLVHYELVVE